MIRDRIVVGLSSSSVSTDEITNGPRINFEEGYSNGEATRVSGKTTRNSKRGTTKATKHRCHGISLESLENERASDLRIDQ